MVKVAPSILSADFTRLGEEIESVRSADYLHFDVMDGVFVPNISIGIPVLESVRRKTDMVLDVHLMITRPVRFIHQFIDAGADIVVVHAEADSPENTAEALRAIRSRGRRAGLCVKPNTPAESAIGYLDLVDIVLVMTVEPGFGGQAFMPAMLPKIERIRRAISERALPVELEVDGGINAETAHLCARAGADVLVAGSFIFSSYDRGGKIRELRRAGAKNWPQGERTVLG